MRRSTVLSLPFQLGFPGQTSLFCLTVQDEGKKFYNLDTRKDDFKDEVKSKILEKYGGQVQ